MGLWRSHRSAMNGAFGTAVADSVRFLLQSTLGDLYQTILFHFQGAAAAWPGRDGRCFRAQQKERHESSEESRVIFKRFDRLQLDF
jgi:hypothetical protein